jgi:hypothetical protein
VKIAFDPAKRDWTLRHRFLDFADAETVLMGLQFTVQDTRRNYGEPRYLTYGLLGDRLVALCWTPRSSDGEFVHHIISMRKTNAREKARFQNRLR